jgi:twitching motility protein PilT
MTPSVASLPAVDVDPDLSAALDEVVRAGASDLHVAANAVPTIRVDGALTPIAGASEWSAEKAEQALLSLLSREQLDRFELEHELDLAHTLPTKARFRVNLYRERGAVGGAFRIIPTEIRQLDELGVPESVGQFAGLPRGLVLVTGPTGSGKSTTLAALIDLVNRTRADHIVTVEDPIEFLHTNRRALVHQREVGQDTHSFAAALKHVLRQDPDVILVGELRDLETIAVALTAAETGHLVFATLHTQDAAQTIDRIIDVFPPHQQSQVRAQLAAALQGVVCQTLVKRASGVGRVVATEVLVSTPAVANLIREAKTHQIPSAMQAGGESGMRTMDQHLADLVNAGTITQQSAFEKAHDGEGLRRLIRNGPVHGRLLNGGGVDWGDAFAAEGVPS